MRNAQPRERRLQLVCAPRARVGDHDRSGRALALQPGRLLQELRDRPVEDLVRSPRGADDVQVDPAARHRAQHEAAERAIRPAEPGDQQASPCGREARTHARQQLGAALADGEAHRNVVPVRRRSVERQLQLGDRAAADGIVAAIAPVELVHDASAVGRVVVGDHEQRLASRGGHGASAPILRLWCPCAAIAQHVSVRQRDRRGLTPLVRLTDSQVVAGRLAGRPPGSSTSKHAADDLREADHRHRFVL